MSLADYAETQDARLIVSVLEDLVEQQRIANLLTVATMADERFGNYAGEASAIRTIFDFGETPESNMKLRDEIAGALGVTGRS